VADALINAAPFFFRFFFVERTLRLQYKLWAFRMAALYHYRRKHLGDGMSVGL
jgi:hypothetical protein